MSVKSAKQFILILNQANSKFKNILKNTSSKFESTNEKLEYIPAKAREVGFNFNSKELETAFKEVNNLTNQNLSKIKHGNNENNQTNNALLDSANKFWNSLW